MHATATMLLPFMLLAARACTATALEIVAQPLDVTLCDLPDPPDGSGEVLDLLAGERPRYQVRVVEGSQPAPSLVSMSLPTNAKVFVLPAAHVVEFTTMQQTPFAQRLAGVMSASVAELEPESMSPAADGSLVFKQSLGVALPPGEYQIIILLSPQGLESILAPQHDNIGGLALSGADFRVLDHELEANKNYALFRRGRQAVAANHMEDAEALADELVARCPGSAVATAARVRIRDEKGLATSSNFQLVLGLLASGTSPCDAALVGSHRDDVTAYWSGRASAP